MYKSKEFKAKEATKALVADQEMSRKAKESTKVRIEKEQKKKRNEGTQERNKALN